MSGWNLADLAVASARANPDATAQISGDRRYSWSQFDRRTDAVAAALLEIGLGRQDKVAQYLYNGPEYIESVFAAFKAALVPVNTNYRYQETELLYLWDNADVAAVVFHGEFADRCDPLRDRLPKVRAWLWVDDGSGPCPSWARPYEEIAAAERALDLPWERDGDDLLLLYTGGTTGMPKGVMWRQDDLFQVYNRNRVPEPYPTDRGVEGIYERKKLDGPGRVSLPACPMMHGTGLLTAIMTITGGGTVVTLGSRSFRAEEMLDAVAEHRVEGTAIVGDAFARPLLQALDGNPGRWDISSLLGMTSSGVMWSEEVKRGLLRHNPAMVLTDSLGSSEAIGMGRSESTGADAERTARFTLGDFTTVLDENDRPVEPGSGVAGRIAVRGNLPVGYYKDPEKTAATFPVVDGVRYSVAGDWARVEADGTLTLLGRGSVCINTGGEKVFPEEVEEVLKQHAAVRDAVCVGVPHERFGEAITALVEPADGGAVEEADLITFVKERLAHYKAPKRILEVASIGRAPSGKVDYKGLRQQAIERLGIEG
ncbi:MAG: acyl-CoA synthetase [Thermoanaerobaculia bacterium]|nr:acyl-CoA synthetase [Thermoanaerobaculia bacterium]